jgi:hypothetical protein
VMMAMAVIFSQRESEGGVGRKTEGCFSFAVL